MEIKNLLSELDALLQKGKFVEAAKKFFSEKIETINEHNHPINGKEAKIASIQDMLNHVKAVHSIKLLNQTISGNTTFSEFNYHYEFHNGAQQSYGEVIKREWDKNGKVLSEKYYTGAIEQDKSVDKPTKKETPTKNSTAKTPAKAPVKKETEKKAAATKPTASKVAAAKPAAKAATTKKK